MADSTTHLDLISASQLQKEVTANALFDAMAPATLYGRKERRCYGLTWAMYGGRYKGTAKVELTYALDANSTTYVVANRSTGTVTFGDVTNWDNDTDYMRLYKIITGPSSVTSYEDHRTMTDRVT